MDNSRNSSLETQLNHGGMEDLRQLAKNMIEIGKNAQIWVKSEVSSQGGGVPVERYARAREALNLIEALAKNLTLGGVTLFTVLDSLPDLGRDVQEMTTEKVKRARSAELAKAGADGAKVKHGPINDLKAWAARKAASMKGTDKDIARRLALEIPPELASKDDGEPVSQDPERLIYDHLRAIRKARQARQP